MPLADKRLRERGFNQAALIAHSIVARSSQLESRPDLLIRTGHRAPQSSLEHDLAKRQENIKNSFECKGPVSENIILIDDVATTGATAAEAARVLLNAGAKNVNLVCLAIGA
jgi:ComF family protein